MSQSILIDINTLPGDFYFKYDLIGLAFGQIQKDNFCLVAVFNFLFASA